MLKKIQEVVPARSDHIVALRDLETVIEAEKLAAWKVALQQWENDSSYPNPFEAVARCKFPYPSHDIVANCNSKVRIRCQASACSRG